MKKVLLGVLFILMAFMLNAQDELAEYGAANTAGTGTVGTSADVTATGLTRGSGINMANGADFNSNGWGTANANVADAITSNDYLEYTITPVAGSVVSLSSFDIRYDRSNSGPSSLEIQYSLDGFATSGTAIYTDGSVAANSEENLGNSLSGVAALQGLESTTTVTFRIYCWGASSGSGTFDVEDIAGYTPAVGGVSVGIVIRGTVTGGLPITLSSFEATPNDNKSVQINWATASEENNEYFSLEHSTDGINFREIDQQAGAGNSTETNIYSYTHKDVANGLHYYRLLQVDYDGAFEYSDIVTAQVRGDKGDVFVMPNPASNDILIQTKVPFTKDADFQILNMQGQVVLTNVLRKGTTELELNISDFPIGIYYLQLFAGNEVIMKKIIKQ